MRFVADLETNGLIRQGYDKIHCLVLRDIDTGQVLEFNDQGTCEPVVRGVQIMEDADYLVGHNLISYDLECIKELYPWFEPKAEISDTLILSRLLFPHILGLDYRLRTKDMPPKLYGRHSLGAWGWRIQFHKGDFAEHTDWSEWSQAMQDYCRRDVELTTLLWQRFQAKAGLCPRAVQVEMDCAKIMAIQERSGWPFDVEAAQRLESVLRSESEQLASELREEFPYVAGTQMIPKRNNSTTGYVKDAPFTKLIDFNPTSRDHIAFCFQTWRDWTPEEFTETKKPRIDETVLKGIGTGEALKFARMLELQKGLGQLSEGKNSWLKQVTREGRIHHSCSLATNTGRNAHRNPNLGQVSSDPRCRSLFHAAPGMVLVGADADGLELRILAHYIGHFDGGAFAKTVVEGDVHQYNADLVGITRKAAKGMIFCLIYGGGDEKLGSTIDPSLKGRKASAVGKAARAKLMAGIPGLKKLTDMVQERSKDGTLKALDGRILQLQGKVHAATNYLCQSAGAIVTKAWIVKFYAEMAKRYTLGLDYQPVSYIHDECNLSVRPELAPDVISLLESTMRTITTDFNLNVQLSATGKSGATWQDVH